VLDGVHGVHGETAPGRVAFRALARPTVAELQALTATITRRVRAVLRRGGLLEEDEELLSGDAGGDEDAALASCRSASARGLSVLPGRPGRGVRAYFRLAEPRTPWNLDRFVLARIARWSRHERGRRLPEWSLARGTLLHRAHGLATWCRRKQPA
jgi:hypothetical protein